MNASVFVEGSGALPDLSGAERVAALLLSVGRSLAARLLKHFDEDELRDVTRAAARLPAVPRASIDSLVDEFAEQFSAGLDVSGGVGEAEQFLTETLPAEQAATILSDVLGGANAALWEKIAALPESRLVALVQQEHPQTAAFILSRLESGRTAAVLGKASRDLRNEVIGRMIALSPVSDQALHALEVALQTHVLAAPEHDSSQSRARVADIVNKLDPGEAHDVMRSIEQSRPKDAAQLKKLLFAFEDLLKLSVRARSTLFDNVSTEVVVAALRGTDSDFRDAVLSSMASRARRLVESELANGAAAAQKDVVKARRALVDTVLKLARRNEIELSSDEDGETG